MYFFNRITCMYWLSYSYMSRGLIFIIRHDRNWDFPEMINISGVGESLFGWPSSNQMACRWWATWTCALKTQPVCVCVHDHLFFRHCQSDWCIWVLYHIISLVNMRRYYDVVLLILMINILIITVLLDIDRHYEHHHCQDCHSCMIIWFL